MPIYMLDSFFVCKGPVELPVIPGLGAQLPGNAIEVDALLPPMEDGQVWVWQNNAVVQMADHRGMAYLKETGKEVKWEELGELPESLTPKPRPGLHYVWVLTGWELDEAAERDALTSRILAERDGLLYEAGLRIEPLQDAIELDRATPEDEAALRQWRGYRVDLNRIEDQDGFPDDVQWPEKPGTKATW